MAESFHLSFPFIFECDGHVYMCPESTGANDIRFYKCTDFPLQWELARTVMTDVNAVDTIVFERAGLWWMLTNINPARDGDFYSALFIYSSAHPLTGDWVAHSANPIIVDAHGGRNAGFLTDGDSMHRPGQCYGFDRYGKSLSINEIVTLTTDAYVERTSIKILPDFFPSIYGVHHIHGLTNMTVFDFLTKTRS